jgi:DNA-binding CsgD family transcriptional regulator
MESNIFKIIRLFNENLDLTYLHYLIDSLELNKDCSFVMYDLILNRFVYSNPVNNSLFNKIPKKYLNNGYQYIQETCHPLDFANLIKEIANAVYSSIDSRTTIKLINDGQILRTKNTKGEWQSCKVHLIYLKDCNTKVFSFLLGLMHHNVMIAENENINITCREKQVFNFLSKGFSAKMIANTLNISENTVITHRKNLIHKLKVKNSAELIKKGYELALNV